MSESKNIVELTCSACGGRFDHQRVVIPAGISAGLAAGLERLIKASSRVAVCPVVKHYAATSQAIEGNENFKAESQANQLAANEAVKAVIKYCLEVVVKWQKVSPVSSLAELKLNLEAMLKTEPSARHFAFWGLGDFYKKIAPHAP